MNIIDIIAKKKNGETLTKGEIDFFIQGYCNGTIPDYQVSALLMAIYFQGMDDENTFNLTMSMMNSGEVMDLSSIKDTIIDKHSTGGIGDKITLIVAPMWAANGFTVAKMSGRGLGYTGGTIDKLESIPEFRVEMEYDEFLQIAKTHKMVVTGQSNNLVPADKLLYALRDVTSTVDSPSLIASSIMSKKLATGSDIIILDVKYGCGAFMKTYEEARNLAEIMVRIGKRAGRKVAAILSPMNHPLGCAVGNSLEVLEALDVLANQGCKKLRNEAIIIAAVGYYIGGLTKDLTSAVAKSIKCLEDGSAMKMFQNFIQAQGGKVPNNDFARVLPLSDNVTEIKAPRSGVITDINALSVGIASMDLGGGRKELGDDIHYGSGVLLTKTLGDSVAHGEVLAKLYGNKDSEVMGDIANDLLQGFVISNHGSGLVQEKLTLIYNDEITDLLPFLPQGEA